MSGYPVEIKKWYMASERKSHHGFIVIREGFPPEEVDLSWQKIENIAKLLCIEFKPICTPTSSVPDYSFPTWDIQ